ncbi:MAG: hypothetical protein WAW96_20465 [Alphaproteobacteria bacterium]
MKIRDLVILGAASASAIVGATVSMADNVAPLPAGGPAAQSEAGGLSTGTIVEIGGVLFAVTIAGLVAVNSDSSSSSTLPTPSAPSTTSTPST